MEFHHSNVEEPLRPSKKEAIFDAMPASRYANPKTYVNLSFKNTKKTANIQLYDDTNSNTNSASVIGFKSVTSYFPERM